MISSNNGLQVLLDTGQIITTPDARMVLFSDDTNWPKLNGVLESDGPVVCFNADKVVALWQEGAPIVIEDAV